MPGLRQLDTHGKEETMKKEPTVEACKRIVAIMQIGSTKDGQDDSWRSKTRLYHLSKGVRHGMTAIMIELGVTEDDGEDHMGEMLTRVAMAICIAHMQ